MKHEDHQLEDVRIESPCSASWEGMRGGNRKRHCDSCNLHVHNFSALSLAEGKQLLQGQSLESRLCVRMEFHEDGRCVTADDPLPTAELKQGPTKFATTALALGASLLAACTGHRIPKEKPHVQTAPAVNEAPVECLPLRSVLGDVVVVQPTSFATDSIENWKGPEVLGRVGSASAAGGSQDGQADNKPEPAQAPATDSSKVERSRVIMGSPGPKKSKG
jgi:hypothetical protein